MKKFLLNMAVAMSAVANTFAADYNYLTFQWQTGAEQSFTASGLTITFSGSNMLVTQNGQTTTIALADLNKMFFSNTASGISSAEKATATGEVFIYSVSGVELGKAASPADVQKLGRGMYIIKQGDKTSKVLVK